MGRNWTEQEDAILLDMYKQHGKQWGLIASRLTNRTPSQVAARWEKCLDPSLTKGPFTPEEDAIIEEYVRTNGPQNWPRITQFIKGRSPKQCRERWFNHLDPSVAKHGWTPEEDKLIFENCLKLGPKWSMIAKLIQGRTDNAIKNRWNSSISKRIRTDENGNKTLLPDSSKRQQRSPRQPKERPPPIMTQTPEPPAEKTEPSFKKEAPPSLTINSPLPFTPFSIATPFFTPADPQSTFGQLSPFPGFQTPGAFGGITSPTGPLPSPSMLSPTKGGPNMSVFK